MHDKQQESVRKPDNQQSERPSGAMQANDGFIDQRPAQAEIRQLATLAQNSPRTERVRQTAQLTIQGGRAQAFQARAATLQRERDREEDGETASIGAQAPLQRQASPAAAAKSGLPDGLKHGIESLSGMSMDHVNVHYDSPQPAQLNAHAYAQGTDIHLAPGQEQHLPHEAWHVVQQAQGRVQATRQMRAGVPLNDDAGLETEADSMGARALQLGTAQLRQAWHGADAPNAPSMGAAAPTAIQRLAQAATPHGIMPIQRRIPVNVGDPSEEYELFANEFHTREVGLPALPADYVATPGQPASDPNRIYAGGKAGYLVNISSGNTQTDAVKEDQGDLKARTSVTRYQEGFAEAIDAKNRLRMVVNVNQYDDPLLPSKAHALYQTLNSERAAVANVNGKAVIIGHLWTHTWKRRAADGTLGADASTAEVRRAYEDAVGAGADVAALKEHYAKPQFRFGQMRQITFNHPATGHFKKQLAARNLQVFMHAGDGDVISVKQQGTGQGIYDRVDAYRAGGKAGIKLLGGGITNQGINNDGDAPSNQAWGIKTVHDLDMSHRESMAAAYGSAPWMTEPNTFIDYDTLHNGVQAKGSWNTWNNYKVDFGSTLANLVQGDEADFSFSKLSIVSSANSHHMKHEDDTQMKDSELNSANFARAIFKHKDTSVNPSAWLRRLAGHTMPDIEERTVPHSNIRKAHPVNANLIEVSTWTAGKILSGKKANIVNGDIRKELMKRLKGQFRGIDAVHKIALDPADWQNASITAANNMTDNLINILNQADGLFRATQAKANQDAFKDYGPAAGAKKVTYADTIKKAAPAPNLFKH